MCVIVVRGVKVRHTHFMMLRQKLPIFFSMVSLGTDVTYKICREWVHGSGSGWLPFYVIIQDTLLEITYLVSDFVVCGFSHALHITTSTMSVTLFLFMRCIHSYILAQRTSCFSSHSSLNQWTHLALSRNVLYILTHPDFWGRFCCVAWQRSRMVYCMELRAEQRLVLQFSTGWKDA